MTDAPSSSKAGHYVIGWALGIVALVIVYQVTTLAFMLLAPMIFKNPSEATIATVDALKELAPIIVGLFAAQWVYRKFVPKQHSTLKLTK